MANVYGIDLGTTYSCIAKCDNNGHIEIIRPIGGYASDDTSIPSVITFGEDGTPIVGKTAKENLKFADSATRTIDYFKRDMGKDFCEKEVLVGNITRKISPIEASACMLRTLITSIPEKERNGKPKAVITIPAGYNNDQRQYVKNAANLAGIEVLGLIHEPTAAAINYGINSGNTVLVFDLGGGTLDVSIVRKDKDKYEVLGFASDKEILDRHIGGIDWDEILIELAVNIGKWKRDKNNKAEEGWYKEISENCKKQFSSPNITSVKFANPYMPTERPAEISYDEFVTCSNGLLDDCMKVVTEAIKKAGEITIDRCVMAGGSSNLRMIYSRLSKDLSEKIGRGRKEEDWLVKVDHPERAIAEGAARYAYRLEHGEDDKNLYIEEKSLHSYGTTALEKDKEKIINLVLSSDPLIITSKKSAKFRPIRGQGNCVSFDVWENECANDSFEYNRIEEKDDNILCYDFTNKMIGRLICNEPYETEREDSQVQLFVSRDKDGIITIEVVEGNKKSSFPVMPSISREIISQIKKSIELLDKEIDK